MKELLKKLLPKIAFVVASDGLRFGQFTASKPDAKNNTNKLALRLAYIVEQYFKGDKDSAYAVIQAELPRIQLEWFSGTPGTEDDDPQFLKTLGEILEKAIKAEPGVKSATLQTFAPYTVDGVELQPGSVFVVLYSTEDELKKIKSKFEKIARII